MRVEKILKHKPHSLKITDFIPCTDGRIVPRHCYIFLVIFIYLLCRGCSIWCQGRETLNFGGGTKQESGFTRLVHHSTYRITLVSPPPPHPPRLASLFRSFVAGTRRCSAGLTFVWINLSASRRLERGLLALEREKGDRHSLTDGHKGV